MIISFTNEDGGAGKTTIPASLSPMLADKGMRILLVDLTPKCSLTRLFTDNSEYSPEESLYQVLMHNADIQVHKTTTEGIDIAVGHPKLVDANEELMQMMFREKLQAFNDQYDYIFIDTANNGNLVEIAITASDEVIIVMKPSRDSFYGGVRSKELLDKLNAKHGLDIKLKEVLLNQYGDNAVSYRVEGELRNHPVFSTLWKEEHIIYDTPSVNRMQYEYKNVGKEMTWIRTAKSFQKIIEDLFEY